MAGLKILSPARLGWALLSPLFSTRNVTVAQKRLILNAWEEFQPKENTLKYRL